MNARKLVGIVSLYKNKKTGEIIVQPMARHPTIGAPTDHGPSTSFKSLELKAELIDAIKLGLERFALPFEEGQIIRKASEAYRKFNQAHDLVRITLYMDHSIRVLPFRYKDGTHVASASDEILLANSHDQKELLTTLRKAFESAAQ